MKPLTTALIFNGPPNSGKDTLADLMFPYGFKNRAMKTQLYKEAAKLFKVNLAVFENRASCRYFKEEAWEDLVLNGRILTPRQALIHTSENYIKPNFGNAYFGKKAAESCIADNVDLAAFSDGGFVEEIVPLQAAYKNIYIFRLFKPDAHWGEDSRSYLTGFSNTYDLHLIEGKPHLAIRQILDRLYVTENHPVYSQ